MSDTNNKKSKRSKTSKDRLIQRMVNAYRKSKRKKKIEKKNATFSSKTCDRECDL